mmetsp:Transcript_25944/g.38567  ORF Transcript_25944/g.38567 Transcript_25944/m.38567 type:complete len:89 (+) Transcript_25944:652-918(+)
MTDHHPLVPSGFYRNLRVFLSRVVLVLFSVSLISAMFLFVKRFDWNQQVDSNFVVARVTLIKLLPSSQPPPPSSSARQKHKMGSKVWL